MGLQTQFRCLQLVDPPPGRQRDGGCTALGCPGRRIEALGGLVTIVLTHRDDVADHARWARALGPSGGPCADAGAPEAEGMEGEAPQLIGDGLA